MTNVAGVIVVREDGAVLLQHRDNKKGVFYPDHWCYPGGVVEKDEPFEESAKRELFEETGYVAKIIFPLQAPDYLRTDGEVMCPHAFWTLYDGKQKIRCNEGREIVFIKLSEFDGKKFIPTQEVILRSAIQAALTGGAQFDNVFL